METKEYRGTSEIKGTYYYSDLISFGSSIGELAFLACCVLFYYGLVERALEPAELVIVAVISCVSLYLTVCVFKIMRNKRVHMFISEEEITVYYVYRFRPVRIKTDEITTIQMKSGKRSGMFCTIKTNRRKFHVRNIRPAETTP